VRAHLRRLCRGAQSGDSAARGPSESGFRSISHYGPSITATGCAGTPGTAAGRPPR
jgi:hypothetical protein